MDDKVYENQVVEEAPFPTQDLLVTAKSETNPKDTFTSTNAKEKLIPKKRASVELLSSALNTRSKKVLQEFALTQSGGFQIGDFKEGLSGDIRITPNGITARDIAGLVTFVLDALTGDAFFRGSIQSGSVITGEVTVGNNRLILTVDDTGQPQIILNDGTNDRLLIGYQAGGF